MKFTCRTAGCRISAFTTSPASAGSFVTTLTTPSGIPASASTEPISRCTPGHASEALSTTVLPHASGIATARVPRITGAFHGAMPRHTPTGFRIAIASVPGLFAGMTSPPTWVVIAAASRSTFAPSMTLNPPHGAVAPVSARHHRDELVGASRP